MKHARWTFVILLLLSVGLQSCGKSAEQGADKDSTKPSVPGTVKESAHFKILMPEKWQSSSFADGTIQVYNAAMTSMVEVKKAGYNMTEKDVEVLIGNLAKQYNGTPVEKVQVLGLTFYKTTYNAGSSHQTMYNALKGGAKISITLMGPDHEKDPTIQAVFASIEIK
jgi:hypothetical protein